jgi:LytTr DNA-binding domain-containing protein
MMRGSSLPGQSKLTAIFVRWSVVVALFAVQWFIYDLARGNADAFRHYLWWSFYTWGGTHAGSGDVRLSQSDQRFKLEASSSALARIVASGRYLERLAIPKSGRVVFIAEKDIDWIESEGNYVPLHVGEHQYDPRQTLTDLEQKLDRADFLRIHRSTIVNARPIKEIQAWFHGYHRVLLFDGPEWRMSRYQHELARQLGLS